MAKHPRCHVVTDEQQARWTALPHDEKQREADAAHTQYLEEREPLLKDQLEAERNFDTLIVTLATAGLAGSFTLLKDLPHHGLAPYMLFGAAMLFLLALTGAVLDRLCTYICHKLWTEQLEDVFVNQHEFYGVEWKEVFARRERLGYGWLTKIKWINGSLIAAGVMALILYFGVVALSESKHDGIDSTLGSKVSTPSASTTAIGSKPAVRANAKPAKAASSTAPRSP